MSLERTFYWLTCCTNSNKRDALYKKTKLTRLHRLRMNSTSNISLSFKGAFLRQMLMYCNSNCCSVAVKIFHYSWSLCSSLTLCSHQMSVRQFRRRHSPNGSTRSCPESAVASRTSTWTCGMDACSLNCWRCCLVNDWWDAPSSNLTLPFFILFSLVVTLVSIISPFHLLPSFLSSAKTH